MQFRKIPHPLRTPETEVCLFTKDEDKSDSEATARHYQELLESKGVTEVSEVGQGEWLCQRSLGVAG